MRQTFLDPLGWIPDQGWGWGPRAEERKGNQLLKLLGSLRGEQRALSVLMDKLTFTRFVGRMFPANPKLRATKTTQPKTTAAAHRAEPTTQSTSLSLSLSTHFDHNFEFLSTREHKQNPRNRAKGNCGGNRGRGCGPSSSAAQEEEKEEKEEVDFDCFFAGPNCGSDTRVACGAFESHGKFTTSHVPGVTHVLMTFPTVFLIQVNSLLKLYSILLRSAQAVKDSLHLTHRSAPSLHRHIGFHHVHSVDFSRIRILKTRVRDRRFGFPLERTSGSSCLRSNL
jgi:hypothetical protein